MILVVCPNPSVDTWAKVSDFQPGVVNRIEAEAHYPGGKGVHVAMALAEYGEEVVLMAFWGGPTGTWMLEQCKKKGIKCYGPTLEGWNRFCFTFSSNNNFNETELLGRGPEIEQEDLYDFIKEYDIQLCKVSAVVMSGSLPVGCPPDFYKNLISKAHSENIATVLDTTGIPLNEAVSEKPTILHLNEHESKELTGKDKITDIIEELKQMTNLSALTFGDRGLYLSSTEETWHSNVKVENVIGTVGSGDCLVAGIAMAYAKDRPLEEVAKYGAAFGAANCMRKELGMIHKEDVDYLLSKVELLNVEKNGK